MIDLKLGQIIYADSTSYHSELVLLEKTTVEDAIIENNNVSVVLGKSRNSWGACPTRTRNKVIAYDTDIQPFVEMCVKNYKDKDSTRNFQIINEALEKGTCILYFEKYGGDCVSLTLLFAKRTYTSLKEGKVVEFTSNHKSVKVYEGTELPTGVFTEIALAFSFLKSFLLKEGISVKSSDKTSKT